MNFGVEFFLIYTERIQAVDLLIRKIDTHLNWTIHRDLKIETCDKSTKAFVNIQLGALPTASFLSATANQQKKLLISLTIVNLPVN